jgi:hypothetical protein
VKKLIATVIAIIAILTMTIPAMAVTTEVTVGSGSGDPDEGAPFVVAKFEVPDEVAGDGVQILPEVPIPPFSTNATDGWKMVKYYVIVSDPNGDSDITAVDIIVSYPIAGDGRGEEKYNLHATRVRGSGPYSDWISAYHWNISSNIQPEVYPTGAIAAVPALNVRELRFQPAMSWTVDNDGDGDLDGVVDGDADCDTADPSPIDQTVPDWLNTYNHVTYGPNPDVAGVFTKDQTIALLVERENDDTGKAIMLELTAYIWCHQDPVKYYVDAYAISADGQSDKLTNRFNFMPVASLYLDFTNIDWGTVQPPQPGFPMNFANKTGDRILGTENKPTIWNNGNFAGQVSIDATKMLLDGLSGNDMDGKRIDSFDVSLDYINSANVTIQEGKLVFFSADAPKLIMETNPVSRPILLPPCTPTQIDFSIGIPSGLNNGDYSGTITLTIANYSIIPATGLIPYELGYEVGP